MCRYIHLTSHADGGPPKAESAQGRWMRQPPVGINRFGFGTCAAPHSLTLTVSHTGQGWISRRVTLTGAPNTDPIAIAFCRLVQRDQCQFGSGALFCILMLGGVPIDCFGFCAPAVWSERKKYAPFMVSYTENRFHVPFWHTELMRSVTQCLLLGGARGSV